MLKRGARWSLVVLGDVLEHMSRADAADVYTTAQQHADAVLVVIPIVDSPQLPISVYDTPG